MDGSVEIGRKDGLYWNRQKMPISINHHTPLPSFETMCDILLQFVNKFLFSLPFILSLWAFFILYMVQLMCTCCKKIFWKCIPPPVLSRCCKLHQTLGPNPFIRVVAKGFFVFLVTNFWYNANNSQKMKKSQINCQFFCWFLHENQQVFRYR